MKLTSITVTGQAINLSTLTDEQYAYYTQLAGKITDIYSQKETERIVIGLSGPAGAGKSVVAEILSHIFNEMDVPFEYVNVGLDAFHYTNTELDDKGLRSVKGRYDTYDLTSLEEKLRVFLSGESVTFPVYSREIHDPIPNVLPTADKRTVILLEGQWLLRDTPEWAHIREYCSYQFFVTGPQKELQTNVVKRHIAGGRKQDDAEAFYRESDLVNTQEIRQKSVRADETLLFYKEI